VTEVSYNLDTEVSYNLDVKYSTYHKDLKGIYVM